MDQKTDYSRLYQALFHTEPPAAVTWEASEADILSQGRGFMAAFDYTMQFHVGCPGGCLFCYVPAAALLAPKAVRGPNGQFWGFRVRSKRGAIAKLKKHLQRGPLAGKTVYWSGVTDPYAASPTLTRAFWETLLDTPQDLRPRRIAVQSRFRPARDAAAMARYAQETITGDGGPAVLVSFSIGTDRNDLIAAWERATPPFEQRMRTIQSLCEAGVFVVATLSPMGLWRDLPAALAQFKAWGVAYLTCLFFKENTRSANTPPLFLHYLRSQYPCLLDSAWQVEQVRTMEAVFGPARVLPGREGFESLAHPHRVGARA